MSSEIRGHIAQSRPDCWSDNFDWLPDSGWLLSTFAGRMKEYYGAYKAFHGCRPIRVRSYYEKGFLGQDNSYILERFREIYADQEKEDIELAIAQLHERGIAESGKTWFLANDKTLINECGHYIIQGSEYLMSLAVILGSSRTGEHLWMRLRDIGVPTVFEVNIPAAMVPPEQLLHTAKLVLSEWGQLVAKRPLGGGDEPCYVIRGNIPSEYIYGHSHPSRLRDPHKGHSIYVNKFSTDDDCACGRG